MDYIYPIPFSSLLPSTSEPYFYLLTFSLPALPGYYFKNLSREVGLHNEITSFACLGFSVLSLSAFEKLPASLGLTRGLFLVFLFISGIRYPQSGIECLCGEI